MNLHKTRWTFVVFLSFFVFVSGCGRTLPAIDQQLLSQKKSLLVLIGSSVGTEEAETIAGTAARKAQSEGIAFDLLKQVQSLDEAISSQIKEKNYDAVLVIGEPLFAGAISLAGEQENKIFMLLQAGSIPAPLPAILPANVSVKRVDESRIFTEWNQWVTEQGTAGKNIVWLNKSTESVPAVWAPSEEADHVVALDLLPDDQWFQQLTHQARMLRADWIVLYSSLDQNTVNKVKTLNIPVVDMNSGLSTTYNWEQIISGTIDSVKSGTLEAGASVFSTEEVTVIRK